MFHRPAPHRYGFTMIEIMVVVCLTGIIMAIAAPNFLSLGEMSRAQACVSNLTQIDAAKKMYALDMRLKATDTPAPEALCPFYLTAMPVCPSGGSYSINSVSTPPSCDITASGLDEYAFGGRYYHGIADSRPDTGNNSNGNNAEGNDGGNSSNGNGNSNGNNGNGNNGNGHGHNGNGNNGNGND